MTLQLPPGRRLDSPDRMIETILAEAEAEADEADSPGVRTLGNSRRARYLLAAVAAAAVAVVGVVGVSVVGRGQQDRVADPPSVTAAAPTPSAAPTSSPTYRDPVPFSSASALRTTGARIRPLVVALGTPVTFSDFTVTVDQLQWTAGQGLLVQADVCVRKLPGPPPNGNTTRISWDPWTVNSSKATFLPQVADGSKPPAEMFRGQDFYRLGECARGWLPFADAPGTADVSSIGYRNELGDQAVWVPAEGKPDIGRKVAFPYLTVAVNGTIAFRREYAIQVTTCVTKRPPGTPAAGLQLSWDAWRLETNHGEVTINDPLTDIAPLPTTYPGGRYRVGDCVTGYIPFGVSRGAVVSGIRYDNTLGDHAVWIPRK